ncbi:MAG: DUF268 domain-containing protein [Luteolibacter sp.]
MSNITHWLRIFGFDPKRLVNAATNIGPFLRDRRRFRNETGDDFAWGRQLPILDERNATSGGLGAYFQQDLLVARLIHEAAPQRHVDVGSRIDGFIGHLAVFRKVEVLDIRPQPEKIPNVVFHQLDLMDELPPEWVGCTDSLSCLHTIEHFGLGRYGDPIDVSGHVKGLEQLKRLVAPGGIFYLSTPMGSQRIEFNAHRIFSAETCFKWFEQGWEILGFSFVDDRGALHESVDWKNSEPSDNFGCETGLAVIVARKLEA